jgi:hypothetical protein
MPLVHHNRRGLYTLFCGDQTQQRGGLRGFCGAATRGDRLVRPRLQLGKGRGSRKSRMRARSSRLGQRVPTGYKR